MIKSAIGLLCAVLVSYPAHAQKAPIRFGDIPPEDFKMTHYEKDSSAAAVVLADYGVSSMQFSENNGFSLNFERITRIKILTKDGLEWADFSLPLYHDGSDDEKVTGLKAVTYNIENGKVVESKMKSDAVFREKYDAHIDIVKGTLPNVKEGSIIEYTYKVNSDFTFNFQDWEFQKTIPIRWSEYRATIPEFFSYDKYTQGYIVLNVNEATTAQNAITFTSKERNDVGRTVQTSFSHDKLDYTENRYRWAAKDVPAFKSEPFMTTYKDYISKINFELAYIKYPDRPVQPVLGSWEEINKKFAERSDFGGEVTSNGFLKKTVQEITAGLEKPEDKIGAIHQYVRDNVLWNGQSRKYLTSSLKKVLEDKKGNSAEINLLLASMLDKADFDVYPVLLSTRDNGFVRQNIPIVSQFNYAICLVKIGDKSILLDATDKLLPVASLPERCLNGNGFVVSKAGYSWIALKAPAKSKTYITVDLSLANNGTFTGKLSHDRSGYPAHVGRKQYFSKGEEEYLIKLKSDHHAELSKSEFKNAKQLNENFKEIHELQLNDHSTIAGSLIYFNPLFHWKLEENPFKLENREYPVDFGSGFDETYITRITIPEDYALQEMPKSKIFALPNGAGRYTYYASQTGNMLNITSTLQINNNIFVQDEYPNLREFYTQVVAKQAEQIVLKKK